jgi:serine/threonine protein kinase
MAEETIDVSYEEEEFDEEFPILETVIENLYKVQKKLGSGGMGFVYKVSIENIYRLRAKEIIAGNMGLDMLDLKPEDIGLEEEPEGRIFDEKVKNKIYEKADQIDQTTRSILKADEPNRKDTKRIVQQKVISDTNADFRQVVDNDGNIIAAMKVSNRSLSKDHNKVKRLLHEGIAFKKLKHPNLVKGIDIISFPVEVKPGQTETAHGYVMEYIEPYNLEEHLEENKPIIPIHFAVPIAKKVLSACSHLHKQGIIHRDIKPSNIMIEKKSFLESLVKKSELDLRLSDLGLGRFNYLGSDSSSADMPSQVVSQEGAVVGTPSYMSPEQINTPTQTGSATDIRSLAATLYHLFTGHVPFGEGKKNPMQIMFEITKNKTPKPMREYNPDVSQTMEDLIMLEFTTVTARIHQVEKTKKGKKVKVWEAVKDDKGRVIYDVNNRLTAEEWELAEEDYEETENNFYTDEELDSLIEEKQGEKLSKLYFNKLGRIERMRANPEEKEETVTANDKTTIVKTPLAAEYDQGTVEKRISVLEKAIAATENRTRKAYLEKMLFYEDRLPIFKEPEPIAEPVKEPEPEIKTPSPIPKKRNKLKIAAMVLAALSPVLGIGGWLGLSYWNSWKASNKAYSEISTGISSIEEKIASDEKITKQYFLMLDRNIVDVKTQLKQERRKLSRDDELTLENSIDTLVKSKTKLLNEWVLKEIKILLDESEIAFSTRNYFEAEKKVLKADENIKQVQTTGKFSSYKKRTEKLKVRIKDKKEILAGKKAALGPLNSAGEQYPGLLKLYEKLKAEVDDGKPFPKPEDINSLEKQLNIHLKNLETVSVEFCDENEKIVDVNFEKTLNEMIELKKDVSREIYFGIVNHKLAELIKLNTQVSQNYPSENAPKIHGQAKILCAEIENIMQEKISGSVLDPKKIDSFNESLSKESMTMEDDVKAMKYFGTLRQKSGEGDENAKEILTLEKRTRNPANHIYIRNGVTTETVTEYSNQINTYLSGKNMRADTYIQVTLDKLSEKIPEQKEQIQKLKEQAKPLFDLSWKIQELDGIIDEKPKDETAKQEREKAITSFTETAEKLKTHFSALKLTEYITQGTATAEPIDYFFLGKAYQTRGDKKRAAQAYTQFLKTAKLGFSLDKEDVKQAEQAIKLTEQK